MIPETDLAWCAGITDTLGAFKVRQTSTGAALPTVSISTVKFAIAERLASLTGTAVTTVQRKYTRMGCGDHCTEAHLHVDSTTARWSLTGARATVFLSAVLPYIRSANAKADALDLIRVGLEAPHKPGTLTKMYELGWPHVVEAHVTPIRKLA